MILAGALDMASPCLHRWREALARLQASACVSPVLSGAWALHHVVGAWPSSHQQQLAFASYRFLVASCLQISFAIRVLFALDAALCPFGHRLSGACCAYLAIHGATLHLVGGRRAAA
eukprot:GHVN01063294.1.p2 GENE.GHVN01063294.1~~GHVN01063294.1.p2  ORF type:complete len:117 (+),score=0.44 GHVN01063294.1:1535-1885(+)